MKLASIALRSGPMIALVCPERDRLWPIGGVSGQPLDNMLELISGYAEVKEHLVPRGDGLALSSVRLQAPIPLPPRNVMCVGKNYRAHAREFALSGFDNSRAGDDAVPTAPIIFTKAPETVIADGDDIRYPRGISDSIDYEAELGVVIGKRGRGISRAAAYEHVFGYTIINDVTARDLQSRHKQWFVGKSVDTFCPMGPWLVTADEIDSQNLDLRCWVNGELRQSANTRDMIFDIPELIATLSAGLTLIPGDVIATGTPAGVGIGFDPPKYLRPGDTVEIEIGGLGRLTNRVV